MIKKILQFVLVLTALHSGGQNSNAYLFNTNWQNIAIPKVSQYRYLVSAVSPNGNLLFISNSINQSGNADIHLCCLNSAGTLNWQTSCGSNMATDDYGTALKLDASGNIYICAALSNGSNADIFVAKYSSGGTQLWSYTHADNGGDDVPADLMLDAAGNVFVTGSVYNANTLNDVVLIKLNSSGQYMNHAVYDYNSLPDGGVRMTKDSNGNVFVGGSTSNSLFNSEFTILKFDTGAYYQNNYRHSTAGNGFDIPTAIDINGNNKIFITGICDNNGNKSIKTLSADNNLNFNWVDIQDKYGLQDEAYDIKAMGNGRVLVAGYSSRTATAKELNLLNYNATNGSITWQYAREPETNNGSSKAHKLLLLNNGDLFVSGEKDSNTLLMGLDTASGRPLFENTYTMQNSFSYANNLNDQNNNIYLCGYSQSGQDKHVLTAKINWRLKNLSVITNTATGQPLFAARQLIFRFNPTYLNMSNVNNKDLVFGNSTQFINAILKTQLENSTGLNLEDVDAIKVFPDFTSSDTLSISRLGDTVRMDAFWAYIIFEFNANVNLKAVMDSVRKHNYGKVYSVEYNHCATLLTNDPQYTTNSSLKPTPTYLNSNIKIGPAWAVETGKPFVKVAVLDVSFNWAHEDFGNGTFAGSVFKGGWDYVQNQHISTAPLVIANHGSKVSSIIGAIHNNGKGISGIAGGNDSLNQAGVSLFGNNIHSPINNLAMVNDIANALVEAATASIQNFPKYLGAHILNNSWGIFYDPTTQFSPFVDTINTLLKDACRFVHKNKVINVFARGNNFGNLQQQGGNSIMRPTTICQDDWIISVGSSDASGPTPSDYPCKATHSDYNSKMDILAPGMGGLYSVCTDTANNAYEVNNPQNTGTSLAAPHASGVAGLMCSYLNTPAPSLNNLAPEDVEQLMERYAYKYPNTPTCTATLRANGMLQASDIFAVLDPANFRVEHFQILGHPANINTTLQSSNQTRLLDYDYPNLGLSYGSYQVDTYMQTVYAVNSWQMPHALGAWPRNSSSQLAAPSNSANVINLEADIGISNVGSNSVTLTGYIYHLTYNNTTNQAINIWYPTSLAGGVDYAWTVHTTNIAPVGIKQNTIDNSLAKVYPNPSENNFTIQINNHQDKILMAEVYDTQGKLVSKQLPIEGQDGNYQLIATTLPKGLYLLHLNLLSGANPTFKLIKHE